MFPNWFAPASVVLEYSGGAWDAPRVLREPPVLSLRAVGLHYGQIAFEGLRAAQVDGRLHAFRPDLHRRRLNRSLDRLSMPSVPGATFGAALSSLLDAMAVPPTPEPGSFLYLRPLVVAVDEDWSMSGAVRYELHVLAGWTLPAFHDLQRVRARVEATDRRALSGAAGVVKVPSNYGSSMVAQRRARDIGAHTVLWIEPESRAVE
ncbi:MAG: aminotransferase class IV, partial [Candidatus Eisenbacteria bacterium]